MSRKSKKAASSPDPKPKDPEKEKALANMVLRPSLQAALTAGQFLPYKDEVTTVAVMDELVRQFESVKGGNLDRGEAMLVAQAHTLDAIFNRLAQSASQVSMINQYEMFMKLALRAQNQARMTWESLAAIKNPPQVAIVRQANFSAGPQQVNNGPAPAPASEIQNPPNKLLEVSHGERLDAVAPGTAGRTYTRLETVEAGIGTEDARREKPGGPKCL